MNEKSAITMQPNAAVAIGSQKAAGEIFYEVSRRPANKRRKVTVPPGTSLRTPSGAKVPPAWTDVWITTDIRSRIQATGLDSKGRRVYLYSAEFMGRAAAAKFSRLRAFGRAYPSLIRKLSRDMKTSDEARVLYLIAKTGFRIGSNAETLAEVKAYGASTLRCSHVQVDGETLSFNYTGKKGIGVRETLKDSYLARDISARCESGSDRNIFKTTDDAVRSYLNSIPRGSEFMVKDFRTYLGTLTALRKVKTMPVPGSQREFARYRKAVGEAVARKLGNSPAIALKSYVSPEVFASWECGRALAEKKSRGKRCSLAGEFLHCVRYDQKVPIKECRDTDPLERRE